MRHNSTLPGDLATLPGPRALLVRARRLVWTAGADRWALATLAVALLVSVPLIAVVVIAFQPSDDIWNHLLSTVLPRYVRTTLLLMVGVALGTSLLGIGTAWLVTMCRLPGRRLLEWTLLLPLAVPTYVIAFVYAELFEYAGPVQTFLRDVFGWTSINDYWFPPIRSLGGAILVLSLTLYPYVYLLTRAAFIQQSIAALEVSRMLGRSYWRSFFTVALPLARPAIVIGVALAMMETLNDFGAVSHLGVQTFTTGIFHVWLNLYSAPGAAQLACVLLVFVVTVLVIERVARRGQRYYSMGVGNRPLKRIRLGPVTGWLATLACLTPILLGFVLPGLVLADGAWTTFGDTYDDRFVRDAVNSLMLASTAAALAVVVGGLLAYGQRVADGPIVRAAARIASVGYAVPGAVLAVGVLIPFAWFDNSVDAAMRSHFNIATGLLLSGTVVAVTYAYVVRFLALSFGTIESGLTKIKPSVGDAARLLGSTPMAALRRVHLPLIRGSVLTAVILVFVEVMKELPATLLLRPFNFNTLATTAYEYASTERLEDASLAALTIVAAGIVPVVLLSRALRRTRQGID